MREASRRAVTQDRGCCYRDRCETGAPSAETPCRAVRAASLCITPPTPAPATSSTTKNPFSTPPEKVRRNTNKHKNGLKRIKPTNYERHNRYLLNQPCGLQKQPPPRQVLNVLDVRNETHKRRLPIRAAKPNARMRGQRLRKRPLLKKPNLRVNAQH